MCRLAEQEKLITKQAADLRSAVNQIATLKSQLKQLSRSVTNFNDDFQQTQLLP